MHKMVIKAFVGGTIRGSDQYVCGYKDVGGTKMYVVVINIYSWEESQTQIKGKTLFVGGTKRIYGLQRHFRVYPKCTLTKH